MAWQDTVTQTVTGLGYDLVALERSAGGLLRVTIDWPWSPLNGSNDAPAVERPLTVEDCETVTRQLHYLLEVEGLAYRRLEVGSPGIDRPLRSEVECTRFAGQVVDLVLCAPIGSEGSTGSGVAANRKKFRGVLERSSDGLRWQLVWSDEPAAKPGQRVSKKRAPPALQALVFDWSDVLQARLAPLVNFKGRQAGPHSDVAVLSPAVEARIYESAKDIPKGGRVI